MITPATYNNLPWFAGDTFILTLNWKDGNGNLFPLTGYTGVFKLMTSPIEDITILTITESTGIVFGDASPNIKITKAKESTTLTIAPIYFTLEVTDLAGVRSRLLQGSVLYKDVCDT